MISILVFTVLSTVFLNGIIGQMNKRVFQTVFTCFVLLRGSSHVPLFKPIHFFFNYQHPHSNIEFPTIYEHWFFQIFLNNKRGAFELLDWTNFLFRYVWQPVPRNIFVHQILQLLEVTEDMDSSTTIHESRFEKPEVIFFSTNIDIRHKWFTEKVALLFFCLEMNRNIPFHAHP